MANVKLTSEVADILSRSQIEGNQLRLPQQLERKTYEAVNKAIVAAGGKWKGGSTQAHVFDGDAREALGMALETGVVVDKKKERQAFYTPEDIANDVVIMAGVSGCHVLEPSAGDGALVEACVRHGAKSVDAIEIEPKCLAALARIPATLVKIDDFLLVNPGLYCYDRVVMNPPFTKNAYVKHVAHSLKFLRPGGRLFAIVPANENPKLDALGAKTVMQFPAGAFKESGTMIATRLISIEV